MAISFGESENLDFLSLIVTLIRPGLVLGFTWWYLTTEEVVEYYKSIT
jgi:hypothetical protein